MNPDIIGDERSRFDPAEINRLFTELGDSLGAEDKKEFIVTADGVNSWGALVHPKGTKIEFSLRRPSAEENKIFARGKSDYTDCLVIETVKPEKWTDTHVFLKNGTMLSLVKHNLGEPEFWKQHSNRTDDMIHYLMGAVKAGSSHR